MTTDLNIGIANLKNMKRLLLTLLFISLSSACSRSATTEKDNPTAKPPDPQAAKTPDKQNQELQNQLAQIASAAKGKVGIAAVVLEPQAADGSRQEAVLA